MLVVICSQSILLPYGSGRRVRGMPSSHSDTPPPSQGAKFWAIIEHPRTNILAALVLAGIGILAPHFIAYMLWAVALLLALRSALEWEPVRTRIPFELTLSIRRRRSRGPALPTAERGSLDFELDVTRALQRVSRITGKMIREAARTTKESTANSYRFLAVRNSGIYKRHKVATSAASGLDGSARRLERLEGDYRATIRMIGENYLKLISAAPNPMDGLAPGLENMAELTRREKASHVEMREAVADHRKLGISQGYNRACDHLMAVLDNLVEDFDEFAGFCEQALRSIAEKSASQHQEVEQ